MNTMWWKAAGVRAVKTLAQTLVATIGTAAVLESVDWRMALSASILAAILSLLTSIAGLPEVKVESRDGIEVKEDAVTDEDIKAGIEEAAKADEEGEVNG